MKRIVLGLVLIISLAVTACEQPAKPTGSVFQAPARDVAAAPATKTSNPGNPGNPVVVIETSLGTITAELYADKAPETVKNFLAYADDKFYDGTIMHRVIPRFMIQGGGYTPDMKEKKQRPPIKNEARKDVLNERGTLAMARLKEPDTAAAEFFINTVDNPDLDKARASDGAGYCVFGKVLSGMDVVHKIERVETGVRTVKMEINAKVVMIDFEDVPVQDVLIKSVRRAK